MNREQAETAQRALDEAVIIVGSQRRLAKCLDVSQQAVNEWVRRGRVSRQKAAALAELTGDRVSLEDLRPDVELR